MKLRYTFFFFQTPKAEIKVYVGSKLGRKSQNINNTNKISRLLVNCRWISYAYIFINGQQGMSAKYKWHLFDILEKWTPPLVLLLNLQFYQYIANISKINNDNICIPNSDMNNFVSFLKVKQKTKTKQKKILYIWD